MYARALLLISFLTCWPLECVHAADKITYETHVQPILREHCFACHNQDDATASLALDTFEGLAAGGAGGEVVSAGDPDGSRLWKLVTHQEEPKMPPGDKLPKPQLDTLKAWIEGGLLKDAGSKPIKPKKPAIATIDPSKLGKPVGEPAMPEQLFHEPVLWASTPGPVEALATSPWAPLIAVGWQRQVSFYHTNSHELLGIIPYVEGVPKVVRFSRDGSLVLVAGGQHSAAGSATLFDVKSGARLATLGDELDIVLAADVSPDLSLVAIGGPKKRVKVYRVADGELQYQITKHTEWITALGFSPDGKLLATADRNGGALIWQAAAGHERADLRGHKGAIASLDWRADSAMLATASEDGTVKLWNPAGNQIKSVATNKGGVLSVRFAQDGTFVTTGRDSHVRTWKPDGGGIADLGAMPGMTLAAAFSHDAKHVVASDYSGEVRVIDAVAKKQVAKLQPNPQSIAVRLAATEESWSQSQQQAADLDKQTKATLANLEQGQAAHDAHDAKLAETQSKLAEQRKLFEEAIALLEEHKQQAESAQEESEKTTAALSEVKQQLEHELAEYQATEEPVETAESEESPEKPEPESAKIAELRNKVTLAQTAHDSAKQALDAAKQTLQATNDKKDLKQKELQAAEALLAQVTNETAGLPDLKKLNEAHTKAKSAFTAKQQQLKQADELRTRIAAQQERFRQATEQLATKLEARQSEQQELAKETGRLEAQHTQAAGELSGHAEKLAKVATQLETLQAQLAELQTAEAKLQEAEKAMADQLRETQARLAKSQQAAELLQQRQLDLEAAKKLREKYSSK